MATIKKIKFYDVNKDKTHEVNVEFKEETLNRYHKDGDYYNKFFIKIPLDFEKCAKTKKWKDQTIEHRAAGKDHLVLFADSIPDVEKLYKEFMEEAVQLGIKEEVVILYRVIKQLPGRNEFHDEKSDISLTLDYMIVTKRSWGKGLNDREYLTQSKYNEKTMEAVFSKYNHEKIGANLKNNDWAELAWTKERELFFQTTYQAFIALINKIEKALNSEQSVIEMIENQQKLLA